MAKRPEGLSPNFSSIVSPQISESLLFSWHFIPENNSDRQVDSVLKVYPKGNSTAILTVDPGDNQSYDLSGLTSSFVSGNEYEWEITVTASNNTTAASGKKLFKYIVLSQSDLQWPSGPVAYEYIGTRQYFNDIKNNAISVLNDYVNNSEEEQAALTKAQNLFTGAVVPARVDFVAIENILSLLAEKESTYEDEVDDLIEDGLGAGDIHLIYDFFDRLTQIPPIAPSNVYLSFVNIPEVDIQSGTASNSGVEDLSVNVSWVPVPLTKGTCQINIGSELDEDVSYYRFQIDAGFTDFMVSYNLVYRVSDITAKNRVIQFPMDHIDFEHVSTSKKTNYNLYAVAVDKRGGESSSFVKGYALNVPLGVSSYTLRHKQTTLANDAIIKDWHNIYNGPNKAYVHNVTGNVTGWHTYSVNVKDKNGTISDWFFIPGSDKIDPLDPPAAPKPIVSKVTQTSFRISWPSVPTADKYEVDPTYDSQFYTQTALFKDFGVATPDTSYKINVRAVNRAGASAWVSVTAKTLPRPIVEYTEPFQGKTRTWRTSYAIYKQNGTNVYPSAQWRPDLDNEEVLHGEWVELENKYESGMYVKKGTRWGNHKSLFFLNDDAWRTRLNGKEILDVRLYIKRKTTQHGYPNDGRFLSVYTHNYETSNLPSASAGPKLYNQYVAQNLDFNRGEGHWIQLPNYYGEYLRDGKIKGIAFHHPKASAGPYSYMRFDADTFQFKIKYR